MDYLFAIDHRPFLLEPVLVTLSASSLRCRSMVLRETWSCSVKQFIAHAKAGETDVFELDFANM